MKGLGLILGLVAGAWAANAYACDGDICERIVVAAAANPFDGSWSETITGDSANCKGSFTTSFQVENGRIIQPGQNGSVNANGSASGSVAGNGFTLTWTGRFSGSTASGSYKRSDGCVGHWQARKQ
jgi:hypothetical protein